MRADIKLVLAAAAVAALSARADDTTTLFTKKTGSPELSEVQVDTAPGSISASALLSLGGDTVTDVHNPRDLAVFVQAIDSSKSFGISVTPARTALMPISLSTYTEGGPWAIPRRLLASTTLGYAQATTAIEAKEYLQRAWSIETSAFLDRRDDPLLAYTDRLKAARLDGADDNPCVFAPAARPAAPAASASAAAPAAPASAAPSSTGSETARRPSPLDAGSPTAIALEQRAAKCRALVAADMRWNTSRIWLSYAGGNYRGTASGSPSHSLGRTIVVGLSWGIGRGTADSGAQLTLGLRRGMDEPVLNTYGAASPTRKDHTLGTVRAVYGKTKLRALIEASNIHDEAPGASERTFKRALGLDARLREGMWLNFRVGKQRRIDNAGDETGASVVLNLSPTALTALGN